MSQITSATEPEANNLGDVLTPEDLETEFRIKRGTQAAYRSRNQIPFVRVGGRLVLYRRAEIEAWLAARAVTAHAPVARVGRKLSPETLAKRKATREANRLKRAAGQQP